MCLRIRDHLQFAALLLLGLGFSFNASATLILGNLANTTDGANNPGSFDVSGGEPLADAVRGAIGFTIGGADQSGNWTFTIRAANPQSAPVILTLVNNNGGLPSETSTFALSSASFVSSLPGGGSGYTVTGNGTLTANTTYWLVASAGDNFLDVWSWVERRLPSGQNPPYTGSAAFAGFANDIGGWGPQGNFYPGVSIDVTPVPEPAHYGIFAALFLIVASAGHAWCHRRSAPAKVRVRRFTR